MVRNRSPRIAGERCDRIAERVLARLQDSQAPGAGG
jgi:hypothetical protein